MEASNYYKDKEKRQFLDSLNGKNDGESNKNNPGDKNNPKTGKEKLKDTATSVGKDLLIGVLGGGFGAAVFGKYSFFAGLALSSYGHHTENKDIATLGLGMMSSGSMTGGQGVKQDPKATMMDKMQERVKAFGDELKRKLFLDKLLPANTQEKTKETNDLKGTEQKKETPVTVMTNKSKVPEEKDILKSEDTTTKEPLFDIKDNVQEIQKKKAFRLFDPDSRSIEERLY